MGYSVILQHSEEDCGAACLATIAKHYGKTIPVAHVRQLSGTGISGTTLLGLQRGAEAIGLNARKVRATPDILEHIEKVPLPAIIHWKGYHWVVLYGKQRNRFIVADPEVGLVRLNKEELAAGWPNGILLLLEPNDARFYLDEPEQQGAHTFRHFLLRAWAYRSLLIEAVALNFAIGLLGLASPIMMQILTDDVLVRKDSQLLVTVAIGVIFMDLFANIMEVVQSHLVGYFGNRLQLGLILDYGRTLLNLPLSYFDSHRSGEIVSRITDISQVNTLVSRLVLGLPNELFLALVSMVCMLIYSWKLTLVSIIAFIVVVSVNLIFLPSIQQKTRRSIIASSENQGFLVETFRGASTLKAMQGTNNIWDEYQSNFSRLVKLNWGLLKLEIYSDTVTEILSKFTNIGLLWLGSRLVIADELSIGQLIAFSGMSGYVLSFLESSIDFVDEFIASRVIVQRLSEVLDSTPESGGTGQKDRAVIPDTANIVFSDVNFHHAGRVDLLKDFTLTIPGGQITALVGVSGCGKSSLAKLLSGLYQPQSGNIRFGQLNYQDISIDCLREQVVLISQDPHFWSRSILNNFRLADATASLEQIIEVCQIAMADEFISELPDKYQTVLGEFGTNLSGGQRQRLAIARAILRNPPILIMDESTSALDIALEAALFKNLLAARQGKTTIVITHRPQVIQLTDWTVVLDKGEIKHQGITTDVINSQCLDFMMP